MIRQHVGRVTLSYRTFFHASFFHIRSGKTGLNIDAVGSHKRLGEVISFQASDPFRSDNGFGDRFDLSSHQIGIESLSQKFQRMGNSVCHIGGVPIRDVIHKTCGGCAGIDIDKIMIIDECRGILPDALFFPAHHHFSAADFLIAHIYDLLLDRCRSTKYFTEFSFFIQHIEITPDRGFRTVQEPGQLSDSHRVMLT